MRRECLPTLGLLALAIVAGLVGWSGLVLLLPVSLAFPIVWSITPNRRAAALVSAGYFLAASHGLPQGVVTFYQSDLWPGLLLWVLASLSFVAIHTLLWARKSNLRPISYLVAAFLTAVPPFGITGWAHPITAAGIVFPGWGWLGLAAMTAGLMGLVTRIRPAVAIILAGFWLWSAAVWTDPKLVYDWRGVDLDLGASLGRDAGLARQWKLIETTRNFGPGKVNTVLLPESALGNWTPTVEGLWADALKATSLTVVAGASIINSEGYDNVLVAITSEGGRVLYHQRMPVPGSMWQPWRSWLGEIGGVRADFFANPVVDLNGRNLAPLICYEQLIIWPVLHSMIHDPEAIVAVGNGWWTAGTAIAAIQRAGTSAWARLFGKPVIFAFNR